MLLKTLPPQLRQKYASDKLKFATTLVDFPGGLQIADLFITNSGGTSIKDALIAETPIIVLPIMQEHLLTGMKIQELEIGLVSNHFDQPNTLAGIIQQALLNNAFKNNIKQIISEFGGEKISIDQAVVDTCESLLTR